MKLRKNWKRFWTLNRHHAEGFTLVELIVVIAILAILGGVAVPAYSGYVKKANMQADMTLISEIEHALTLAYYNQDLPEGSAGFILLSPVAGESMVDEIGLTEKAMEKVFGIYWLDSMQLQYADWGMNKQTLSVEEAQTVINSNFVQKYTPNELMNQVQTMTDAVSSLNLNFDGADVDVYKMFSYGTDGNAVDDVIKEYYDEDKEWDDFDATEKSNLLVLATAFSINGKKDAAAASAITAYAAYAAFAAENPGFKEKYDVFQNSLSNIDPDSDVSEINQIANAYSELQKEAETFKYGEWSATVDSNGKTKAENSIVAFQTIMKGVDNAMEENGDAILGDLDNANLFTTGVGSELYQDYLEIAYTSANGTPVFNDEILPAFQAGMLPGTVLIQYAVVEGQPRVTNSLPIG